MGLEAANVGRSAATYTIAIGGATLQRCAPDRRDGDGAARENGRRPRAGVAARAVILDKGGVACPLPAAFAARPGGAG